MLNPCAGRHIKLERLKIPVASSDAVRFFRILAEMIIRHGFFFVVELRMETLAFVGIFDQPRH